MKRTILLTGGARSGKSQHAQDLASTSGKKVLFVATAEAGDDEMRQRILAHQQSRPPEWGTLEAPSNVATAIMKSAGGTELIIVDCITMLVNNVFGKYADYTSGKVDAAKIEKEVTREIDDLAACFDRLDADFIVVTNEVGLGLVPANPIDRMYRDLLGKANRILAGHADEVYLMVSGLPLRVK